MLYEYGIINNFLQCVNREQAIPAVDALSATTLDISVINQISYKNKKFVQERGKELKVIQRHMSNATCPLCVRPC